MNDARAQACGSCGCGLEEKRVSARGLLLILKDCRSVEVLERFTFFVRPIIMILLLLLLFLPLLLVSLFILRSFLCDLQCWLGVTMRCSLLLILPYASMRSVRPAAHSCLPLIRPECYFVFKSDVFCVGNLGNVNQTEIMVLFSTPSVKHRGSSGYNKEDFCVCSQFLRFIFDAAADSTWWSVAVSYNSFDMLMRLWVFRPLRILVSRKKELLVDLKCILRFDLQLNRGVLLLTFLRRVYSSEFSLQFSRVKKNNKQTNKQSKLPPYCHTRSFCSHFSLCV